MDGWVGGGFWVGAVWVLSGDRQGVLWGLVGIGGVQGCNLVQLGATGFGLAMGLGVCGVCAGWLFTGWVGDIWWDGSGVWEMSGLSGLGYGLSGVCKMLV